MSESLKREDVVGRQIYAIYETYICEEGMQYGRGFVELERGITFEIPLSRQQDLLSCKIPNEASCVFDFRGESKDGVFVRDVCRVFYNNEPDLEESIIIELEDKRWISLDMAAPEGIPDVGVSISDPWKFEEGYSMAPSFPSP